jgi:hypothetical protein
MPVSPPHRLEEQIRVTKEPLSLGTVAVNVGAIREWELQP